MNCSFTCILFAAGIDWLESLLPFLFVGFWILSQVYAVFRRVAGGGGRVQPPPVQRREVIQPEMIGEPPRPPAPPAAGPDARDELQKQIEEFLRQATGASSAPPKPKPKPRPVVQSKPTVPKPAAAPPAPPTRDASLRPGSERHVGSLETGKTEVARHVQDAFAHDLKHARASQTTAQQPAPQPPRPATARVAKTTAADLLQALRNPATIRQTILLREVLERPVDRW